MRLLPPPRFTSDKDFKARVVLIDRYNVLTEDTVEAFAETNKFRRLPDDRTPLGVTLGKVVGAILIFARALEISARRENLPQTQVGAICAAIVVGRNGDL
jgi:hypothetical protein